MSPEELASFPSLLETAFFCVGLAVLKLALQLVWSRTFAQYLVQDFCSVFYPSLYSF